MQCYPAATVGVHTVQVLGMQPTHAVEGITTVYVQNSYRGEVSYRRWRGTQGSRGGVFFCKHPSVYPHCQ
jgi:hypothetical protein